LRTKQPQCHYGSQRTIGIEAGSYCSTHRTNYDTLREEAKMLVLSRKVGQRLVIGDSITIVINRIAGNRVQIGIEAPEDVHIMRGELDKIRSQFSDDVQASVPESVPFSVVSEFDSAPGLTSRSVH
jgi:carbon storage regulator